MDETLSRQISLLRPVCIILMMSVHVNPGFDPAHFPPVIRAVAAFEVDVLGRASVSTLSLISGFLIAVGAAGKGVGPHILVRFRTLYLPALLWNAVFLAMVLIGAEVTGSSYGAMARMSEIGHVEFVLQRLLFLFGEPGTPMLAFLRDLFVASVITIVLARAPFRTLAICTLAILVITLFGSLAPVVYREPILLFMLAGCIIRRSRGNLRIARPLLLLALPVLFYYSAVQLGLFAKPLPDSRIAGEVHNLGGRAALAVFALWASHVVVKADKDRRIASVSDVAYLAFLSHTTVISLLWVAWSFGTGWVTGPGYVVFFFGAQGVAFASAMLGMAWLARFRSPVQIAVVGKATTPRRRRETAASVGEGAAPTGPLAR